MSKLLLPWEAVETLPHTYSDQSGINPDFLFHPFIQECWGDCHPAYKETWQVNKMFRLSWMFIPKETVSALYCQHFLSDCLSHGPGSEPPALLEASLTSGAAHNPLGLCQCQLRVGLKAAG